MNKTELISAIAEKANLTKAQSAQFLDAYNATVEAALDAGDEIRLVGFGTYSVKNLPARETRNPATGKMIKVKASRKPVFKFGKAFADKLNK